ncbi:hypothetical protein [Vampirovibrio sp.]|uniref:hypothetical protein n=1 Tax=Vampirovibrio sp. TaxID=2717857 RepID=UPI003593905D
MSLAKEAPIQACLAEPVAELSDAEFIALAERDRDAAIALMWPEPEEQAAMKLLDAVAFDGFIASLKGKLAEQSLPKAD